MRFILNVIWLVLCGIWMSIAYAIAGLICFLLFFLVITIPFGIAAFRIANYVLWPFGRTIAPREGGMSVGALIGNIIWIILFGWGLAGRQVDPVRVVEVAGGAPGPAGVAVLPDDAVGDGVDHDDAVVVVVVDEDVPVGQRQRQRRVVQAAKPP